MCARGAVRDGGAWAAVERGDCGVVHVGLEQDVAAVVGAWMYRQRRTGGGAGCGGQRRFEAEERKRVRLTRGAHGRLRKRLDARAHKS